MPNEANTPTTYQSERMKLWRQTVFACLHNVGGTNNPAAAASHSANQVLKAFDEQFAPKPVEDDTPSRRRHQTEHVSPDRVNKAAADLYSVLHDCGCEGLDADADAGAVVFHIRALIAAEVILRGQS